MRDILMICINCSFQSVCQIGSYRNKKCSATHCPLFTAVFIRLQREKNTAAVKLIFQTVFVSGQNAVLSFALGQTRQVVLMTPNVVAEMTVALHVNLSEFIVESRHTEISDQLSPAPSSVLVFLCSLERGRESLNLNISVKVQQTEPSNL